MTTINPYLTFKGNCEEAFGFYKSVFGGEFTFVGRFKDMPADPNFPVAEGDMEKIMHIALPISEQTILMGSDSPEHTCAGFKAGNNFSISIHTETKAETDRLYKALSDGGSVVMPLDKTFWGAYFGMVTDQFGINWMVNCELKDEQA